MNKSKNAKMQPTRIKSIKPIEGLDHITDDELDDIMQIVPIELQGRLISSLAAVAQVVDQSFEPTMHQIVRTVTHVLSALPR